MVRLQRKRNLSYDQNENKNLVITKRVAKFRVVQVVQVKAVHVVRVVQVKAVQVLLVRRDQVGLGRVVQVVLLIGANWDWEEGQDNSLKAS